MHNHDLNRVKFFSKEDMARGYQLSKGEHILRQEILSNYTDINDILELYNIKKYIDNDLYLRDWLQEDIEDFKNKVTEYGKIIGQFMSKIDDNNIMNFYEKTLHDYISSFWEIVNNQKVFKQISKSNFSSILSNEAHLIHEILKHKALVDHYDAEIKSFLLTYSQSAEILLSIYEVQDIAVYGMTDSSVIELSDTINNTLGCELHNHLTYINYYILKNKLYKWSKYVKYAK